MTEQLVYKQTIKKAYKIKQYLQQQEQNLDVINRRLRENKEKVRIETRKLKEKYTIQNDKDRIAALHSTIKILQKELMDAIEL